MKRLFFTFIVLILFPLHIHAFIDWPHVIGELSKTPENYDLTPVYGGASNVNYHLNLDSADYFVRVAPKAILSLYADLEVEYEVLELVSKLGVSAKPLYYDREKRILVTDFIHHDHEKIDLLHPETRRQIFAQL